jgi:hypothetical protein
VEKVEKVDFDLKTINNITIMNICYIISTCDKYLDSRVKSQMDSFLKDVPLTNIYYLTSRPNLEKRQFGWNCMDDPQNITWKYIHFIYNTNIPDYDWYIFIDDDTFVFNNRLENLLSQYDSSSCYYIGKELDHIKDQFCLYMSGGAGYAISNALYSKIYEYIRKIGVNEAYYNLIHLKEQFCDDLCIGLWIQEIAKSNTVHQINNNLFYLDIHKNESELTDAITFHKVISEEQFQFYNSILDKERTMNIDKTKEIKETKNNKTVFTLVTDIGYFSKAKRTIFDLRCKGNWCGDIVVITIEFDLNANFKDFYNITEVKFPKIDKTDLLGKIGRNGFSNSDKRELTKLNQWEKLHVFDPYFKKWQQVVFLDAGLRILDDVKYLLEIDCKDKIMAPKDGKHYIDQEFHCQLSYDKPELIDSLTTEFGESILKSNYMLNCMWMYDTSILDLCNKEELVEAMNKYPFCKTNEMGIMNLLFHFKYHLWEPFPVKASNNKFLFDWCELNQTYTTSWRDYCFIKYPVTISFEDT